MVPAVALALGVVFVVTGASALIVEQAFEKLLSTVVGSSTQAGAIVLAVYFGGLSLGGLFYARLARRFRSPLALYAALEAVVGVAALLLGVFFAETQAASTWMVQLAGENGAAVFVVRIFVAALWILPPTVAMGATYPAVVSALEKLGAKRGEGAKDRLGTAMARIYAANLLGAAAAAFVGPYFAFPILGMTGALLAVAGMQAMVVAAALGLARLAGSPVTAAVGAPATTPAPRAPHAPLSTLFSHEGFSLLATMAIISGFVIFALEVLWIHLIGATLGMSVYAFAMMLTLVLLGLFAGGALVSLVSPRRKAQPAWMLPAFAALASAVTLAFGTLWDQAGRWLLALGSDAVTFAGGELVRFQIALGLVFVPSVVLGLIYPSLFKSRLFPTADASRAAGVLAAVNAGGSILGALVAGFFLLPVVGSEPSLRALAVAPGLLALPLLASRACRDAVRRWLLPAFAAAGVALVLVAIFAPRWDRLALTSGVNVYFRPAFVLKGASRLLSWFEDSAGGITTVVATKTQRGVETRTLLTNGKFQGNDSGEVPDQIAFGLVPAALVAARDRALVIGLGTGQSANVLNSAGFAHVDIADISPGMGHAARKFFGHINGEVLEDPKVAFHLEDGRNFLLRTEQRFDVISIELTSIWFAGAANLYSREFYRMARQRLAPGGVLQQWVQFHHAAPEEVASVLATVRAEFPTATLWVLNSQGLIIASEASHAITPAVKKQLAAEPRMRSLLGVLERLRGVTLENLSESLLLDEADVTRLAATVTRLNTDANRYLEYATPRHNLERFNHQALVLETLLSFVDPHEKAVRTEKFLAAKLR